MVRDQATKGFVNHTEEFGPWAGAAGNRECHGQMVSSVIAADVWRRDLEMRPGQFLRGLKQRSQVTIERNGQLRAPQ